MLRHDHDVTCSHFARKSECSGYINGYAYLRIQSAGILERQHACRGGNLDGPSAGHGCRD